ncbi:MAG TPA: hypothetical protein VGD66_15250 [Allosphingosinicella sp.]|jgi:hypothetical protein
MDRRGRRARALIAAALALAAAAPGDAPLPPIREARWVDPAARFMTLSREPAECLVLPPPGPARRSVEIGRAAFRAPLLLGGQGARAGLSCASCHRNGRGNPAFLFPGLSGAPGTADVTSSLMSSHRGDHQVNPKPIPDLGGPRERLKIPRDRESGKLEAFIHGLVTEEFDGPEPPPEVLGALADYVRALQPEGCGRRDRPIRLADRLSEAERAVRLARGADPATARMLIAAARSTLGAVDERFRRPGLERDRDLLLAADAELRAIRDGTGRPDAWLARWPARRARLLGDEGRSLYAPRILSSALAN